MKKKYRVNFTYSDIKWLMQLMAKQKYCAYWFRDFDFMTQKQFDDFKKKWDKVFNKLLYIDHFVDPGIAETDEAFTYEAFIKNWRDGV